MGVLSGTLPLGSHNTGKPGLVHEMSIFDTYPKLQEPGYAEDYDFTNCWTATHPQEAYEDEDVAAALILAQGNLGKVARLLHRPRRSVSNHVARNLPLAELQDDMWEEFIDAVEEKHQSAALNGDVGTQRFFLTTRGKNRGYTTRVETTGKDGAPIEGILKVDGSISDSALEELMAMRDRELAEKSGQ